MREDNTLMDTIEELLKKENCHLSYAMKFPRYNILPDEVQLALKVLERHDMRILFVIKPNTHKQTP